MIDNILMVCTGNICRSPMAEGIFRTNFADLDYDVEVASAGLHALVGEGAAREAQECMKVREIDITDHEARQLTHQMLLSAGLVLVMEEGQKKIVEKMSPFAKGRVFLLGHWSGYEIFDPFRQPAAIFERCAMLIEQCWQEWKQKLC